MAEKAAGLEPLRPYQLEAIQRAMRCDGFALFMEQRTGKTRTALGIVRRRNPARLLIVCPKRAIPVWKAEIAKVMHVDSRYQLRTVTYAWAAIHKKELSLYAPDMIIADESHVLKKRGSKQSRALRWIAEKSNTRYRLILSGTPADKGAEHYWAQFDLINPSLLGTYQEFSDRFLRVRKVRLPGRPIPFPKIVGYKNQDEFKRIVAENSYRIELDEAREKKTKVLVGKIYFELGSSRMYYDEMFKRMQTTISGKRVTAPLVISQIEKLQQICSGATFDKLHNLLAVGTEKISCFEEFYLRRLQNEPCIVFVKHLHEIDDVAHCLYQYGKTFTIIKGGSEFSSFTTDVAIVQIKSGLSIDLSRASVCVFYSMNYSHIDHEQARFRVRSYTNDRVRYYYLLARNTIEEDIFQAVRGKKSLTARILDRYL